MATYAIGDIQGCYDQLRRLLKFINFNADRDTLWFCGDLVNRGPKSLEVLRFIRGLGDGAVTVLGNHDLFLISLAHGNQTVGGRVDSLAPVLKARDSDKLINWLAKQPFFHYDSNHKAALVHAGIPPGWTLRQTTKRAARLKRHWRDTILENLRKSPPAEWSSKLTGVEKDRFMCAAFTRMRFVDEDGVPEYGAKGPPKNYAGFLWPWFHFLHRDWDDTRLFFGHWSTLDQTGFDDVIALDSGCVWGRELSAVRVSGNRRSGERYCVDCAELGGQS